MNAPLRTVIAALLVAAAPAVGSTTDTGTMMCAKGIVSIGTTAGEVLAKCGQPATATNREDRRVAREWQSSGGRRLTTVSIDDWIFNFGPNQFQYQVILENGRVVRIESRDYGY